MSEISATPFLNVPSLLESSRPRPRASWLWYGGGMFLLLLFASSYASEKTPGGKPAVQLLTTLLMLGLISFMGFMTWLTVRSVKMEQRQLESIEELLMLRRWAEAAQIVEDLLSRPARSPQARALGLVYLAKVLARYHRYGESAAVCEHLLASGMMDSDTTHALRIERAMGMLHEDRLFDVDGAINELRRMPQAGESAGLALVEIYRDVKTGHPDEAITIFEARLPVLRRQLSHRVADAYALVARAYDLLGRAEEAQAAYDRATLLAPAEELGRRYPEVVTLAGKYAAALPPVEGAC